MAITTIPTNGSGNNIYINGIEATPENNYVIMLQDITAGASFEVTIKDEETGEFKIINLI